jgi:8-oxo-dGTP pyrophosphatase MutT (NUDIX family)/phage portal protein BeeE
VPNLLTTWFRRDEVVRYTTNDYIRWLTDASRYGLSGPLFASAVASSRGKPAERIENNFQSYVYGGYKSDPIVFACMTKRSSVFSEARFMWRRVEDGRPGDLFSDDALGVLARPWPNGTTGELLTRMIQDVDLAGNFYVVNEGDRLRRLRPDWVQIVLTGDPREAAEVDVAGYVYTPGGPDSGDGKVYLPDEVAAWSPVPDPDAQYRGMSWMTPVVREIQGDHAATDHKLAFFRNGATLGPIVKVPAGLTVAQFREFIQASEEAHAGADNAYKTFYVGGGADVTLGMATLQQMDFKTVAGHYETRICVAAQVPAVIAGVSEGLAGSSLNAGNYQSAKRSFVDGTMRPLWRSACAALQTILRVPDGAELWFDERDIAFLRDDAQDVAQVQQTQAGTVNSLITAGFEPNSAVAAVMADDLSRLRHTGLTSVQLMPPGAQDADGDDTVDEYATALEELRAEFADDETVHEILDEIERRFNPAQLRHGKGSALGGQFRSLSSRVMGDLTAWLNAGGRDPDPLRAYKQPQLKTAATQLGLNPPQGMRLAPLKALLMAHASRRHPTASGRPLAGVTAHPLQGGPFAGRRSSLTVDLHGTHIGAVHEDTNGHWSAYPIRANQQHFTPPPAGATKDQAIQSLVAAATTAGAVAVQPSGPRKATAPAVVAAAVADPAVKAAQDVLYGVDPKARTAARQLVAYGALRRAQFDNLDPAERSTLLGDLSYIATTSKGANADRAQKLIDRFTPPGTPLGTVPAQAIVPPAGAVTGQTRVADPSGTPGLLKMLPAGQRGRSGDGWTRKANGGTGPWGQYGAAGLLLRHVDANGEERFLMIERGPGISDPGKWQFPGGAKDEKEDFYQGAAREVVEELGFATTGLDSARVHGTHAHEAPDVTVPSPGGGSGPWSYVSIAATVPTLLKPDLTTHHARMETSDARWMTRAEISALDAKGKLLGPLAGGQLERNVISLFPASSTSARPAPRTTRPARLSGAPAAPVLAKPHKPSKGRDLIPDRAGEDKLRADVAAIRKSYRGKTADERLAAIGAIQGYDDTPTVAPKAEMDRLLATGEYIEAWRGVRGSTTAGWARSTPGKTAAQINEDMRSGPAYYGTGIFGNGYYLTTRRSVAESYSDYTKNSLLRVLIPKSAKTETHSKVARKARMTSSSSGATYVGRQGDLGGGTLRDEGRYAAAVGLDGIEIPHTARSGGGAATHIARPGEPSYNWVNRSVLIIQEAEK